MTVKEIKIRNIDAAALHRIDQLADKKGMSRNAYLKSYIETLSVLNELKEQENKYANLVNSVAEVVEHNTEELKKIRYSIEKIIKE